MAILLTVSLFLIGASAAYAQNDANLGTCGDESDRARQIRACTQIIQGASANNARRAGAYLYRCQAKDLLKQTAGAIADCERSISLRGTDPSSWNSMAIVYQGAKRWQDAIQAATHAITIGGDRIGNYYNTRANARCGAKEIYGSVADRIQAIKHGRLNASTTQKFLKKQGFYQGAIDGAFGPASENALQRMDGGALSLEHRPDPS
jgi:tetratricopeptide (TPR) repeat protein